MCRASHLSSQSGEGGMDKVPPPSWIADEAPVTKRRCALPEPQVGEGWTLLRMRHTMLSS